MICDPATTQSDLSANRSRPLYERQIAMLGQLAEESLEVALAMGQKAKVAETPEEANAFVLAYGRAARAVRLSLMAQAKAIQALEVQDKAAAHNARTASLMAKVEQTDRAEAQKARVENIIERIAERADNDPDEIERIVEEAGERLDREDFTSELLSRPISELVALICQDLGLDPDWSILAEEAWARQEASSGSVGWPLAGSALSPATFPPPRRLPDG